MGSEGLSMQLLPDLERALSHGKVSTTAIHYCPVTCRAQDLPVATASSGLFHRSCCLEDWGSYDYGAQVSLQEASGQGCDQFCRCSKSSEDDRQRLITLEGLPDELLQRVLWHCEPKQLAALETSCRHFFSSCSTEYSARRKLATIPWAGCLSPQEGETWVTLLRYASSKNIALPQATALSLGAGHTAVILSSQRNKQGRSLATFGLGCSGELGRGSCISSASPLLHVDASTVLIGSSCEGSKVVNPSVVVCGRSQTAIITRRGELYSCGLPLQGGVTSGGACSGVNSIPSPVILQNGARIVGICQGTGHTLAISENHQLLACGRNECGQLGIAHCGESNRIQSVKLGQHAVASVAAGESHSLCLGFDGTVWAWGLGNHGQLGHEVIAIVVKDNLHTQRPIVLHEPKRVASLKPGSLPAEERVSGIAAGGHHSAVLTLGGDVLCFGCNQYGCLGLGHTRPQFVPTKVELDHLHGWKSAPVRALQVACGKHHTIVLAQCAGTVLVCGAGLNDRFQLGLGDSQPRSWFTEIPFFRGSEITAVACGDQHSAAVSASGQLFLWGQGTLGQLGHGYFTDAPTPIAFDGGRVVHPSVTLGLRPLHYYRRECAVGELPDEPAMCECGSPVRRKPVK